MNVTDFGLVVAPTDFGAEKMGSCHSVQAVANSIVGVIEEFKGTTFRRYDVSPGRDRRHCDAEANEGIWYKQENESFIESVRIQTRLAIQTCRFPFMLGGDHSSSIGTVLECHASATRRGLRLGVLWIDSHPDMNTPATSPSGRLHGMAVATTLGLVPLNLSYADFLSPSQYLEIGINSIDTLEALNISALNVRCLSAKDLREGSVGIANYLEVWSTQFDELYVSIDLDSMSPDEVPGVNAPCKEALSRKQVTNILAAIPWNKVVMWDMVEYNLFADRKGMTSECMKELTRTLLTKVAFSNERPKRTLA